VPPSAVLLPFAFAPLTAARCEARPGGMTSTDVAPARSGIVIPTVVDDPVRRAVAAYLSRFKGRFRVHNESDLRSESVVAGTWVPALLRGSGHPAQRS
jgi:hypothetical protein